MLRAKSKRRACTRRSTATSSSVLRPEWVMPSYTRDGIMASSESAIRLMRTHPVCWSILLCAANAFAQQAEPPAPQEEPPAFEFTVGGYRYSDASHAYDLNLRNASSWGNT